MDLCNSFTPVKSESLSTDLVSLMGSISVTDNVESADKISTYGEGFKRPADIYSTIEGSPFTFSSKRLDQSETPSIFRQIVHTIERDSVTAIQLSEITPIKSEREDNDSLRSLQGINVLVVNSDSDTCIHDTGDHQENRMRTTLLTGPDGCLRRKQLADCVIWEDESKIIPANLTDLLRVHEYSYLSHLENKIRQHVNQSSVNVVSGGNAPEFYAPPGYLDCDTPLSVASFDAAKRFCG